MTEHNIKYIHQDLNEKMVKKMLNEKGKEYGNFANNAHVVAGFIRNYLEVINKQHLQVPIEIVPALMIVLKLTRTIDDGTKKILFKEDTHSDIGGYNSLLRSMMKFKEEDKHGK